MILAVGFRVRSRRGSQFRQWAIDRLGEYLVKGFTMDDERLKGQASVVDYFDELLARIRDIRASEARVYLMIRNIFALAADYAEDDTQTQQFFATVQNKMHYAATGLTAAEIISQRANAERPNMGLTNWKGTRVSKADTGTAKNYLNSQEIDTLNRITVMFLDQAEFRAQRRQTIQMADWGGFLDKFLADVELPVLQGAGSTRRQQALKLAHQQYDQFAEKRRLEAKAKLASPKTVFLDVRATDECKAIRLAPCRNVTYIPLDQLQSRLAELGKEDEIVAFCRISTQGYEAECLLEGEGFKDVKVLEGGVVAWPFECETGETEKESTPK